MALQHAASGERIVLKRGADDLASFTSVALVRSEHMELIRLMLPKGKALPEHRVEGEMTLQVLEGEMSFVAHGRTTVLHPDEMVFLAGGEPHSIHADKDSVALMTILLHPGDNTGGPTRDPRGAS